MKRWAMNRRKLNWLKAILASTALAASGSVAASGLFTGENADLWLVNPETGQVTGYDYGQWLEVFLSGEGSLYPLTGGQQALINNAARSSQPMTPGQPAFSLSGLGVTEFRSDSPAGHQRLILAPEGGTYTDTIALQFRVQAEIVKAGASQLRWQSDQGHARMYELTVENLQRMGAVEQDGYYQVTEHLVKDATYVVNAGVIENGDTIATASATLTLASDHPDGFRRDTDGDGIPDLIEASIGMDPYDDNWFRDSNGDGWSDFDLWLRGDQLDSETGLPKDSDSDGWADFDEQRRGTNPADPEFELSPAAGEDKDSEAFRKRILSYKDYPTARRLYEVEYRLSGQLVPSPAEPNMKWTALDVANLEGHTAYRLEQLLTSKTVDNAGLKPDDIAPRRLAETANKTLAENKLPPMRLPAGSSLVVRASHRHGADEGGFSQVYKAWLNRVPDANPAEFLAARGVGDWETPAQWKQGFVDYLNQALVVDASVTLDGAETARVAMVEAGLSREAQLQGKALPQLLGNPSAPVAADLVRNTEQALGQLAQHTGGDAAAERSLDQVAADIQIAMEPEGPLATVAAAIQADLQQPLANQVTERAVIAALLEQPAGETAGNLHRIRLHWLPDALTHVALDETLLAPASDSDGDGANNTGELIKPLTRVTLPWQADYDGDSLADMDDPCPRDAYDLCSSDPVVPIATLEANGEAVEAGTALVSLTLDRAYDEDVVVQYTVTQGSDDTAVAGKDFIAVTGTVVIRAGERTALIPVEIIGDDADENAETFSVQVTDIANAAVANDGLAQVVINDFIPLMPQALVAQTALNVNERANVTLDASSSVEPTGDALVFSWEQIDSSGTLVILADNASPSFTAPVVQDVVEMAFRVTVINRAGLKDTETVTISVNPVDDPPQVATPASYSVTEGQILSLTDAELLSHVHEPDGDEISIDAVITQPQGELTRTPGGFDYVAKGGGEQTLSKFPLSDFAIAGEWVFHVEEDTDRTLHTFLRNIDTGKTEDLPAGLAASDIRTDSQSLAYLHDEDAEQLYLWEAGEELRMTTRATSLGDGSVDPITKDLYSCDWNGTGNWERIDYDTLVTNDTGVECVGAFSLPTATLGAQAFCMAETMTLDCTDGAGNLAEIIRLPSGKFQGLFALDDKLLAFASEVDSGGTNVYRTYVVTPDLKAAVLLDIATEQESEPAIHVVDDGLVAMIYDVEDEARMWHWSGAVDDAPLMADLQPAPLNDGGTGQLFETDGKLYWIRGTGSANLGIYTLDPRTGAQSLVQTDAAGSWSSFPFRLFDFAGSLHYLSAAEMSSADFPQCHLRRLDGANSATTVMPDVNCSALQQAGESLVSSRLDIDTWERALIGYKDSVVGNTGFSLSVSDSNGNSVALPVSIRVEPGP